MDIKNLESIGFTSGESKVYFALLQIGETTTGEIIKKSGISGSKVYEILDKLIAKGMVSYITKGKMKYFQPAHPKRILDYINQREKNLDEQKMTIQRMIPQLEKLMPNAEDMQTFQLFEGYGGLNTVFSMILETVKPNGEYFAFSLGDELRNERVNLFLENYHQKRIAAKIKVKILAEKSETELFNYLKKIKNVEVRYCSSAVPTGVFIFGNYVATVKFSNNPVAFVILSNQIANSYKRFFENIWNDI